ncbi:MFS transporter [Sphaerisporangium sp. NPDC049002]|uniref:MFS transporter n=1 Tax=unclassified Sphaerisporangium TaxID=2630420 RepID=UPI0033CA7D44
MPRLLRERPRPQRVRAHQYAPWFAVGAVCVGAFMGQLDASIVTLIFPALQRRFDAPLAAVQWVAVAYLLALVALLIAAGRLADVAGRKLIYLYGFVVFTGASVACGFAPSLAALVACRVVQAAGAAMLQANSVALVVTSVRRERARAALGMQAAAQSLGLALGPTAGGFLVGSADWRWVFWINAPVGLVAIVAGRYLLPRTREHSRPGAFDWGGLLLLGTATTGLLLAASGASGLGLPVFPIVALLSVALASAAGLRAWERRASSPLLDVTVLRSGVVAGLAGALCAYLVLFGPLVLFSQVLVASGLREPHAGLVLSALPAGFAFSALTADHLAPRRWGNRARCVTGALVALGATALLAITPTAPGPLACFLALLGLGLGLFVPANNAAVMAAVPARTSATAGGMINMARGIGTALGVAGVTLALYLAGGPGTAGARLALGMLGAAALVAALTATPACARVAEVSGRRPRPDP